MFLASTSTSPMTRIPEGAGEDEGRHRRYGRLRVKEPCPKSRLLSRDSRADVTIPPVMTGHFVLLFQEDNSRVTDGAGIPSKTTRDIAVHCLRSRNRSDLSPETPPPVRLSTQRGRSDCGGAGCERVHG